VRDDFDAPRLGFQWVFLRNLPDKDWSLTERPGSLALRCTEATLDELASPAFVGRRQQHFEFRTAAALDFDPKAGGEEAGLTALIDHQHHAEIVVTRRDGQRVAFVRRRIGTMVSETAPMPVPEGLLELTLTGDRKHYHFGVAVAGSAPQILGRHELRYLSTQVAGGYTGVVIGMFATSQGQPSEIRAYFDWFDYEAASPTLG
jgi:alpha-N-arabinofuranosidase